MPHEFPPAPLQLRPPRPKPIVMRPDPDAPELQAAPLQSLLSQFAGPVALFDPGDRLHWANPAYRQAFGVAADATASWVDLMRAANRGGKGLRLEGPGVERELARAAAARRVTRPSRAFESVLLDGRTMLFTQTTDARGWLLEIAVDMSCRAGSAPEPRAVRADVPGAAADDPLTGVPLREAALARLRAALADAARPTCVALVNIDQTQRTNTRYGREAGDQVLRDFALRLRDRLRRDDACGRVDGDCFLVMLDGVTLEQAEEALNRLCAEARESQPLPVVPYFRYSVSAGLVQALPGEDSDAVLARAGAALQAAKDAGRDRCIVDRNAPLPAIEPDWPAARA